MSKLIQLKKYWNYSESWVNSVKLLNEEHLEISTPVLFKIIILQKE